MTAITADSWQ